MLPLSSVPPIWNFSSPLECFEKRFIRFFEGLLLVMSVVHAWLWAYQIQRQSEVILSSGLAHYIDPKFMFVHGLSYGVAVVITFLSVMIWKRTWKVLFYWMFILLMHWQYVSRYTMGKLPHGTHYLGLSLILLALGYSFFSKEDERVRFTMDSIYFFIGFAYFSSALSKLIASGIGWANGSHLILWIHEKSIDMIAEQGFFEPNVIQHTVLNYPWVGTVVLAVGLLIELCAIFLWIEKLRLYLIPLIIGMHIGIYFTMNILFDLYLIHLSLLYVPVLYKTFLNLKKVPHRSAVSFTKNLKTMGGC